MAVPLVRSATNDAYESSIGRGGPPLALLLVAAFAASVALATVMARHVLRGFASVGAAGLALLAIGVARDLQVF